MSRHSWRWQHDHGRRGGENAPEVRFQSESKTRINPCHLSLNEASTVNKSEVTGWWFITFYTGDDPPYQCIFADISKDTRSRFSPGDWVRSTEIVKIKDNVVSSLNTEYTLIGTGFFVTLPVEATVARALNNGIAPNHIFELIRTMDKSKITHH